MRDPEDIAYISQLHDEATEAAQEIASLRAEIERLRGYLLDACKYMSACGGVALDEWWSAGRGEG